MCGDFFMLSTIIRTAIMYIFVTFAIRLMGKRQIGDLQPNELVITLLISEIAAIPLQDTSQPILNGVVAIFVLIILEIIISVISMKSIAVRKIMSGKSVVIIKNGLVDRDAMKQVRMTTLDLIELLRQNDVFDISQVEFAVLEVNGNLSVMLKPEYNPVTPDDLKLEKEPEGIFLPVICDGKVIPESLRSLEITRGDLEKILNAEEKRVSDIFLMTVDRYKKYKIIGRRKNI